MEASERPVARMDIRQMAPLACGAHVTPDGVRFVIFSRHARRVWLLLFDHPDRPAPDREVELDRVGDLWFALVSDARPGQGYAYRMQGPPTGPHARYYNPDQWLLDPYALAVAGRPTWGDAGGITPGQPIRSGPAFPKGVILADDYDWEGDRFPDIPLADSILYELHTRGFTVHPSAQVTRPGTYAGLIEKIPYLEDLGVTAVELLPMQEFNEMEYLLENGPRRELRNFWGYSTQNFFAPMGRFASAGVTGQQVREFKDLVKALHRAGIEVILDMVFNHTDEGAQKGPVFSFRGIDNDIYYLMDKDGVTFSNHTGCGNSVNANHPVVRGFILDCLRYWRLHLHVDGFRFDLASEMTRGTDGAPLAQPPLIEAIAEDPALRGCKLIAEAWDCGGLYQVGSFPNAHWSEWNGRYRDDMRRFWKGDPGQMRGFVNRLIGSPDLYAKPGQTPQKSINYFCCHDGFTLHDLVSYERKHNDVNREDNRDGDNNNHSANYGQEGPTTDPALRVMRQRQMRNMLATLMLSQGVPMLAAGDEFGRTQRGNNNAYAQDNEISWVDWSLLEQNRELWAFTRSLIAFRKDHAVVRRRNFLDDQYDDKLTPHVLWFPPDAQPLDWDHAKAVACFLNGHPDHDDQRRDDHFFICFNADTHPLGFKIPAWLAGLPWGFELSTQETPGPWRGPGAAFTVEARSVTVLRAPMASEVPEAPPGTPSHA